MHGNDSQPAQAKGADPALNSHNSDGGGPVWPESDVDAVAADRQQAIDDLEHAYRSVSAAQRRLRGRDAMLDGLSVPQYSLLRPLLEHDELSAGELSRSAGLTPATATHMLEQLARAGMIERERSAGDRRVVMTRLTPQGREQLQARHESVMRAWTDMIDGLSNDALRNAAEVMRLMERYIDSM